jgi:hypothetical protein
MFIKKLVADNFAVDNADIVTKNGLVPLGLLPGIHSRGVVVPETLRLDFNIRARRGTEVWDSSHISLLAIIDKVSAKDVRAEVFEDAPSARRHAATRLEWWNELLETCSFRPLSPGKAEPANLTLSYGCGIFTPS